MASCRPRHDLSVHQGIVSRGGPQRTPRNPRNASSGPGSLEAAVGLDGAEGVGDDHRVVIDRVDVAAHAMANQVAIGGCRDIRVEGAVDEAPIALGPIVGWQPP